MTKDKIKNTPELVDYLLDESIMADSRKLLRERMDEICNLAIKALEQEPRKGHWIEKWDSDHLVILAYECSECGMMMNVNTSHYCPNCGAEMQEVRE